MSAYDLVGIALEQRGEELRRRLERAFADAALPREEVVRLLKLIAVFDDDPKHAPAADAIVELLREVPSAMQVIARCLGRAEDPVREAWSRFEAEGGAKAAPHVSRSIEGLSIRDVVSRARRRVRP